MTEEQPATESPDDTRKPRIDWADPNIPIGDAPPLPRWPLVLGGLAWASWVVFLVMMVLSDSATGTG